MSDFDDTSRDTRSPNAFVPESGRAATPSSVGSPLDKAMGIIIGVSALLLVAGCSAADGPSLSGDGDDSVGPDDSGQTDEQDGTQDDSTISIGSGGGDGSSGTGGAEGDPCLGPMPPADCELDYEPSGPGCGDGEINVSGEECDDGNGLPGDGCSGSCKVEPNYVCDDTGCTSTIVCGDGVTQPGEVCDDGNTDDGDGCAADCFSIETGYSCPAAGGACSLKDPCKELSPPASCFPPPGSNPYCGDGEINNSWEECDDGNTLPGDGCNGACAVEPNWDCSTGTCVSTIVCGDGVVSGGEVCDDGDQISGNGCESDCFSLTPGYSCPPSGGTCEEIDPCTQPNPPSECFSDGGGGTTDPEYCGDGSVNVTGEECDDGNTVPGDGCSGACLEEANWDCSSGTCVYTIVCGDGKREGSEVCDDGDNDDGDGCAGDCGSIDPDYSCPPTGGECTSTVVCGDGRITGTEECEDGDATPAGGDGCDANCMLEDGYYCPTVGQECEPVATCGDGVQTGGEECDDGGSSAPGCDANCAIEDGYACPTPGEDCVAISIECGDGNLAGDEECDDGNGSSGDGCSSSCVIEDGYSCSSAGAACTPICGDGKIRGSEVCDDGGTADDDGCSSNCTWEPGYFCDEAPPHDCQPDTCGNGEVGNDEACDDGNTTPGDGCAPDCTAEPDCSSYGSAGCTSSCGDGVVINEECDDGNTRDGDGCSSTCTVETGFECVRPTGCSEFADWDHDDDDDPADLVSTCVLRVPVVYRDFDTSHPHFEPGWNSTGTKDMVEINLDSSGKPVWSGTSDGVISSSDTSPNTFSNWYRNSAASVTVVDEIVLWDRDRDPNAGSYDPDSTTVSFVNRWGSEGEKYGFPEVSGTVMTETCGNRWSCSEGQNPTSDCTCNGGYPWNAACNPSDPSHIRCFATIDDGGEEVSFGTSGIQYWYMEYESGYQEAQYWDGNPVFFPLDGRGGSPTSEYSLADVPSVYGGGADPSGEEHNFHFTSEVRRWFEYADGNTYQLDFTGDDDVWVFINGHLAVDLGGWHEAQDGSIAIAGDGSVTITEAQTDGSTATTNTTVGAFELVDGGVYEIAVFQAERKYTASSYRLTLTGFNANPSTCESVCGDGIVASDEECDDGVNDGGYGECQPGCVLGSFCGDGTVDPGEDCDNGTNLSGYNDGSSTACAPGCVDPKACGDGTVDYEFGEVCDAGASNSDSDYEGCTTSCQLGPHCGDGQVQDASGEECDDGVNDGAQGCGPGCVLTAACGNGIIDPGEECDDGVNDGSYGGCTSECLLAPYCGDGQVDTELGETCDDTVNDGSYGGCNAICQLGPHCGDGVLNGSEACDDGVNDGSYGACGPGCTEGPRCGDGTVQSDHEECDDGTNDGTVSACEAGCVLGPYCGDGTLDPGEECDDGTNDGGYGQCAPECKWGPRCGDGQVQSAAGEECDDGTNDGSYGSCAPNCQLGPYCGDGQINGTETCDDGVNDGSYGRCTQSCEQGPYCGDGIQQPEEQCDDGTNDGEVSACQPGCTLGPGCGDGVLQEGEQCDLGLQNSYDYDGCLPETCEWGPHCGDGVVQSSAGEQCDDGVNPGGYGECAQNCRLGPYCGDGVVNGDEVCDDGVNDGGYGECAAACKLGPYCGDGTVNGSEECDDGNRTNNDGCSSSCLVEDVVK